MKQGNEYEIKILRPVEPEMGMPSGFPGFSLVRIGEQWYYREISFTRGAVDIPIPASVFVGANWDFDSEGYFPRKLAKVLRETGAFFHRGLLRRADIVDIAKLDKTIAAYRNTKN